MALSSSQPPAEPRHLLNLPAELRIEIYEFTLLDTSPITIDKDNYQQPALLAVNHQIRHEAANIYYRQNRFIICLPEFDSTAMIAFRQHSRVYLPASYLTECAQGPQAERYTMDMYRGAMPPRNWANLLKWANARRTDNETVGFALNANTDIGIMVAARILRAAEQFPDLPWETLLFFFEMLKDTAREGGVLWT